MPGGGRWARWAGMSGAKQLRVCTVLDGLPGLPARIWDVARDLLDVCLLTSLYPEPQARRIVAVLKQSPALHEALRTQALKHYGTKVLIQYYCPLLVWYGHQSSCAPLSAPETLGSGTSVEGTCKVTLSRDCCRYSLSRPYFDQKHSHMVLHSGALFPAISKYVRM
jgi:hypothetical protein